MSSEQAIANMEGLQAAISNGETKRGKELLAGRKLDTLQKDYLIDLAKLNGSEDIVALLKDAPEK